MKTFHLWLLPLLITPAATAQSLFDQYVGRTIEWTGGDIGLTATGDFTGDLYRDVALIDGSDLKLAYAPGRFTHVSTLQAGATAMCAVPGAVAGGLAGTKDGLVVAGGGGWMALSIAYGNQTIVKDTHTDSNWSTARSLRLLSKQGGPDAVVALNSAGTKLLWIEDPFGTPASYQRNLGRVALDVAAVDWVPGDHYEVAVLHQSGLDVVDLYAAGGPTTTASFTGSFSAGVLTAFRDDTTAPQRVAAVVETTGGSQLYVADATGYDADSLPVSDVYALVAGSLDDDSWDDLVLAHQDSTYDGLVYYVNQCTSAGACTNFDAQYPGVLAQAQLGVAFSGSSAHECVPALDDLTSDGDVDLVWFSLEDEELRIAENTTLDHEQQFLLIDTPLSTTTYDSTLDVATLEVYFDQPAAELMGADAILVEEWRQFDQNLMEPTLEAFLLDYPADTAAWANSFEFMAWPSYQPKDGWTTFSIRPVCTEGSAVVAAGPASLHTVALTLEALGDLRAYLDSVSSFHQFTFTYGDLSAADAPPPPTTLPPWTASTFEQTTNTPESSGGGTPPEPPPIDGTAVPKTPSLNL